MRQRTRWLGGLAAGASLMLAAALPESAPEPAPEGITGADLLGHIKVLASDEFVGHRVAQGERCPEWLPGTEFRARRGAMLKAARP